jgi:hypothetical protein
MVTYRLLPLESRNRNAAIQLRSLSLKIMITLMNSNGKLRNALALYKVLTISLPELFKRSLCEPFEAIGRYSPDSAIPALATVLDSARYSILSVLYNSSRSECIVESRYESKVSYIHGCMLTDKKIRDRQENAVESLRANAKRGWC